MKEIKNHINQMELARLSLIEQGFSQGCKADIKHLSLSLLTESPKTVALIIPLLKFTEDEFANGWTRIVERCKK